MAFSHWADFFTMGGHGFYVWSAYGITFMLLFFCFLRGKLQEKKLIQRIKKIKGKVIHASTS